MAVSPPRSPVQLLQSPCAGNALNEEQGHSTSAVERSVVAESDSSSGRALRSVTLHGN
jgi:hypothetical protein